MRAIILAAGRGSRMKQLTEYRPKCLVEVNGKALLLWQLEALRSAGIQDIAIVTGYKREMIAEFGLTEFYNARWAETNMVRSLECAQSWLREDVCIVSYSDIFYQPRAVRLLMESKSDLAVTYDLNWRRLWTERFGDPLLDAETFRLAEDSTLAEIGNKPKSIDEIQGQYMGLLRFTPKGWGIVQDVLSEIPAAERDALHMTGTLQRIIQSGAVAIAALPYDGEWGEVDSKEDLLSYISPKMIEASDVNRN